ncbi:4Fe-4S binding protein [Cetobacterium sp.]
MSIIRDGESVRIYKDECIGCGSCASVCSVSCISQV